MGKPSSFDKKELLEFNKDFAYNYKLCAYNDTSKVSAVPIIHKYSLIIILIFCQKFDNWEDLLFVATHFSQGCPESKASF